MSCQEASRYDLWGRHSCLPHGNAYSKMSSPYCAGESAEVAAPVQVWYPLRGTVRRTARAHTSRATGGFSTSSESGIAASTVHDESSFAAATYQVGFQLALPLQA